MHQKSPPSLVAPSPLLDTALPAHPPPTNWQQPDIAVTKREGTNQGDGARGKRCALLSSEAEVHMSGIVYESPLETPGTPGTPQRRIHVRMKMAFVGMVGEGVVGPKPDGVEDTRPTLVRRGYLRFFARPNLFSLFGICWRSHFGPHALLKAAHKAASGTASFGASCRHSGCRRVV